jgi:ParB family chromosome partitioning protein
MAKRRKLEAPSAADLEEIEDRFRRETLNAPAVAPIAQVAGEAAREAEVLGADTRAKLAEAQAFQEARDKGLVLREIPIDRIRADELVRDRAVIDRGELDELRASIVKNGLRLPIEVYPLAEPTEQYDYALISGYRRLLAFREAFDFTELERYATIKCMVRAADDSAQSIAAMVEENEVRASLSHFERGRIAALSAQSGVFLNVEDAVSELFPFASKAKRSKVRSFALVFEEIGDVLTFAELLTEKQGLRIASGLRNGAENALRDALAEGTVKDAREEWAVIEAVLAGFDEAPRDASRGGRPKVKTGKATVIKTDSGVNLAWEPDGRGGYVMRLTGAIDRNLMDDVLQVVRDRLA